MILTVLPKAGSLIIIAGLPSYEIPVRVNAGPVGPAVIIEDDVIIAVPPWSDGYDLAAGKSRQDLLG